MKKLLLLTIGMWLLANTGCKTIGDVRDEESSESNNVSRALKDAETQRADLELVNEELKMEIARLGSRIEQGFQKQLLDRQELQQQIIDLNRRLASIEAGRSKATLKAKPESVGGYTLAKKLFGEKKYRQSISVLRQFLRTNPSKRDVKRSRFLLAETYFSNKDYGLSALEYSQYKENYPNDTLAPRATYRQAHCFRNLGKNKEARLFYQELLDKYPRNSLAKKAKSEIQRLK